MAIIRVLGDRSSAEIYVVHWDTKELTPYRYSNVKNVTFYECFAITTAMIIDLAFCIGPDDTSLLKIPK